MDTTNAVTRGLSSQSPVVQGDITNTKKSAEPGSKTGTRQWLDTMVPARPSKEVEKNKTKAVDLPPSEEFPVNRVFQAVELAPPSVTSAPAEPQPQTTDDRKPAAIADPVLSQVEENSKMVGKPAPQSTSMDKSSKPKKEKVTKETLPAKNDPTRAKLWGGFSDEHVFHAGKANPKDPVWVASGHGKEWYEDHYLFNAGSAADPVKFHANAMIYGIDQAHFDLPSLETTITDKQVPLYSDSGGRFENPATGQLESVHQRVPKRITENRISGTIEVQTHTDLSGLPSIPGSDKVPFLSPLFDLHRGDLRVMVKGYYITEGDLSGQRRYEVKDFGAAFNPKNGDIDGFIHLQGTSPTERFDWNLYTRYTAPDFNFSIPGLAWAADQYLGTRPFKPHAEMGFGDTVAKMVLNPTISLSGYYERNSIVDPNKTTELIPFASSWGGMAVWKDTGIFVKIGKGFNDSKLYFKDINDFWLGIGIPTKTVESMLGLKSLANTLAGDLQYFNDEKGEPNPLAPNRRTDLLLWDDDKLSIAYKSQQYHNPQNPLLGELVPGQSQGPGGPDGKNVRASSDGAVAVISHTFNSKPFKSDVMNTLLGDTRVALGMQYMNLSVDGRNVNILTPLGSEGSSGSVTTLTPPTVEPDVSGSWWSASIDVEKNIRLGNYGYLKVGPYFDIRHVLGEVSDNSYSDKALKTVGILVGYTPRNSFTRGPYQL